MYLLWFWFYDSQVKTALFPNTYPLDSDLSGGWHYPTFEQPEPEEKTELEMEVQSALNKTQEDSWIFLPWKPEVELRSKQRALIDNST